MKKTVMARRAAMRCKEMRESGQQSILATIG